MAKLRTRDPYELMKQLKEAGQKFNIEKTLYTMDIYTDYGDFKWISPESEIPQNELFFVKMVTDAVNKMGIESVEAIDTRDIKYFSLNKTMGEFTNCFEVDISGAYWAIAKEFLPQNVYERGLLVSKKTRLAALGGLAKTKTFMEWDGKSFINTYTETARTKDLFFYCAKRTGDIMDSLRIVCDKPLFYWVDAIFTASENDLNYIYAVLNNEGMQGKQYFCENIKADDKKIEVFSKQHQEEEIKKGKKARPFRTFYKERESSNHFIGKFKEYLYTTTK